MKLIYNSNEDRDELKSLIQDWLLSYKGKVFSGVSARMFFNELYGIDIDHHEYARVLDFLQIIKSADFYNHNGGDTQYIIK